MKMEVEIWSDVMCPFCYIGKRKFESALEQFAHKDDLAIKWHSFELDPDMKHVPGQSIHDMLAEKKGWTPEQARQMNQRVVEMAKEAGLQYDMDKAVPANTFDAHRLIQLAGKHGLQNEVEERLFAAYFTEGKNIGEHDTLITLGKEIGLDETEVKNMLESKAYTEEVHKDEWEAQQLGIRGVPFFVMDRKYGVSGAQSPEVFLQTLEQSWQEWRARHPESAIQTIEGDMCTPDGDCTPRDKA